MTNLGRVSQPIIAGADSTAAQNAVVEIQIGSALCTGTLIAPNLVLTARHCVSEITAADCTAAPGADFALTALKVYTGTARPALGATPRAVAKKIVHDDTTTLCGHDLALIVLDTSINDAPTIALRTDVPPVAGETFTAVGWGVTNTEQTPTVRQQRTGLTIAKISANEFEVGESICEGDSGGPAIANGVVIGVASRGGNGTNATSVSAGCAGATNTYTSVAAFKALIDSALAEATADAGTTTTTTTSEPKGGCSTSGSSETSWLALAIALVVVGKRRMTLRVANAP